MTSCIADGVRGASDARTFDFGKLNYAQYAVGPVFVPLSGVIGVIANFKNLTFEFVDPSSNKFG